MRLWIWRHIDDNYYYLTSSNSFDTYLDTSLHSINMICFSLLNLIILYCSRYMWIARYYYTFSWFNFQTFYFCALCSFWLHKNINCIANMVTFFQVNRKWKKNKIVRCNNWIRSIEMKSKKKNRDFRWHFKWNQF